MPVKTINSQTAEFAQFLADKSLKGHLLSQEESFSVLSWPDDKFLLLLNEVFRVRQACFGKKVKMNFLANIQSGLCPEDCSYCSQSKNSQASIEKYRMMTAQEVVEMADKAVANKASRLCMVSSMRGPNSRDLSAVTEMVKAVKKKHPHLELCACLGLLEKGQAKELKEAGVDAYNHNLNTSERYYDDICKTHTHQDRVDTVEKATCEGLSACSGAIFGMGETQEDILDVAYRLQKMNVDSIPINFLIPVKGTALSDKNELTPHYCLKILCLFRLLCPKTELRIAGGRELQLRSLQPLALYAANSLFIGDYLTTQGQASQLDRDMIRDMGFEILGESAEKDDSSLKQRVSFTSRKERLKR